MSDNELSAVASVIGGSACPQADDTRAPAIALGTTRSTVNALRTPMNCERTAHTAANQPDGFTLAELLVSVSVLVLLTLLATQLLNSAAKIITLGHKQMDAGSQARELFDRMAIDFAQIVRRADIDYYLKSSTTANDCRLCTR